MKTTTEDYKKSYEHILELFKNASSMEEVRARIKTSSMEDVRARINKRTDEWLGRQARDDLPLILNALGGPKDLGNTLIRLDEALRILKDEKGMEFEEIVDGLGLHRIK